jgi:glycerol kinase
MQIQSDLLGHEVVRPAITETTALGAALLAGLAVGFWKDYDDIARRWKVDKSFLPDGSKNYDEIIHYWHKALDRTKKWIDN